MQCLQVFTSWAKCVLWEDGLLYSAVVAGQQSNSTYAVQPLTRGLTTHVTHWRLHDSKLAFACAKGKKLKATNCLPATTLIPVELSEP